MLAKNLRHRLVPSSMTDDRNQPLVWLPSKFYQEQMFLEPLEHSVLLAQSADR